MGRLLRSSKPLERDYQTHRIKLLFNKGFLFYAEFNFRLFFWLLFKKSSVYHSNDLDTLLAMWIVAKIKNKEFNILRNSLKEKLDTVPEVYGPKILIDKFIKNKLHKKKKWITNIKLIKKLENFYKFFIFNFIKVQSVINFIILYIKYSYFSFKRIFSFKNFI